MEIGARPGTEAERKKVKPKGKKETKKKGKREKNTSFCSASAGLFDSNGVRLVCLSAALVDVTPPLEEGERGCAERPPKLDAV